MLQHLVDVQVSVVYIYIYICMSPLSLSPPPLSDHRQSNGARTTLPICGGRFCHVCTLPCHWPRIESTNDCAHLRFIRSYHLSSPPPVFSLLIFSARNTQNADVQTFQRANIFFRERRRRRRREGGGEKKNKNGTRRAPVSRCN